MSLGRAASHPQALTAARWASWVSQPHEWSGILWMRWNTADASILYSRGRARVSVWSHQGWIEGSPGMSLIGQRIQRTAPRWGQLPLLPDWASALSELELVHAGLPTEVVRPEDWLIWASRHGYQGAAVLLGEAPAAWVLRGTEVLPVPFPAGGTIPDGRALAGAQGIFQVYQGAVPAALLTGARGRRREDREAPPPSVTWEQQREVARATSTPPSSPSPEGRSKPAEAEQTGTDVEQEGEGSQEFVHDPLFSIYEVPQQESAEGVIYQMPAPPPGVGTEGHSTPKGPERTPRFQQKQEGGPQPLSSAPHAWTGPGLRFRGDERFMLAPNVDLRKPAQLEPLLVQHGRDLLHWLPMFDGERTLEEIVRDAGVAPRVVDEVVAWMVEKRMVFRYRARPRG